MLVDPNNIQSPTTATRIKHVMTNSWMGFLDSPSVFGGSYGLVIPFPRTLLCFCLFPIDAIDFTCHTEKLFCTHSTKINPAVNWIPTPTRKGCGVNWKTSVALNKLTQFRHNINDVGT